MLFCAICFRWTCFSRGSWARWSPEFPSNLHSSVILWKITSFAYFALATALLTVGMLERQDITQLLAHTSFSFGSSRRKKIFPGISGQFQIGPTKFQLPNESKTRQRNSSLKKLPSWTINKTSFFFFHFHFSNFLACSFVRALCSAVSQKSPFSPCTSLSRAFSGIHNPIVNSCTGNMRHFRMNGWHSHWAWGKIENLWSLA